jgi:serine/threonine protein kinase
MHSQRICHSDFKLENCVINRAFDLRVIGMSVFLLLSRQLSAHLSPRRRCSDFAYACKIPQGKLIRKFNGSPAYSAPEILFRRPHDETVDLWSLGVCLFFMLCGYFPFCDEQSTTLQELALNVRAGVLDFPFEDNLPAQPAPSGPSLDQQPVHAPTEAARDMCVLLLSPKKRPGWGEITRHPFYRLFESARVP